MKTTKLLAMLCLCLGVFQGKVYSQCSLITVNGSSQDPKTICAPVDFIMHAAYQFLVPVDTSKVKVLFRWNDGTGAESLVSGNWNASGDSIWTSANHLYPPTDECSREAEAILVFDGKLCESSGYQSQLFSTWGTDEENSGILHIQPEVHYVCEGESVTDFTFRDNSTFNCNINIEPDRPNRYYRWVQFVYNTYNQGGHRIPNVSVRDQVSKVHQMTDTSGNFIRDLHGPIVRIPIPADRPNQTTFPITAPAGGVAGDIFEITLRNWNVCNPYDNNPNDGIPPLDTINGDNAPITTTARIQIIAPTPIVVPSKYEFCTGDKIILQANADTAEVRWYKDPELKKLLYVGNNFNPTLPPESLNPYIPGSYRYYVTSYQGLCESAPYIVDVVVYESPENAKAGLDKTICSDTVMLVANIPKVGTGEWTTSGSAKIANPKNATTLVSNLEFGPNDFKWTITNGPCSTSDNVTIISDRQPSSANAGGDQFHCDQNSVLLDAVPADKQGVGFWNLLSGSGIFADSTNPMTEYRDMAHDKNLLVWRVASKYGACPVTIDSLELTADFSPGIPDAGPDLILCETKNRTLLANSPVNKGLGAWEVISGTGVLADSSLPNSQVDNLAYGINKLTWKLRSKLAICPEQSDTLLITRFQSPGIANAGIDKKFCLINQDTLNANSPVVGKASWLVLSNPSGIAPTFSPNNQSPDAVFSVAPGNEGSYLLQWQMINGSCISADSVVIDFGVPAPQAKAGPDTITCGYDYPMLGNSIPIGIGTWTKLSGPGAISFSPDSHSGTSVISFSPGDEGVYEFEWRFTSGSCPATADSVSIEITEAPLPPPMENLQSCGPSSFDIKVPVTNNRQEAYWYKSATASSYFYKGLNYTTGPLTTSTSYFVSLYDKVTTCESGRTRFNITIDEVPKKPVLLGDTICGSGVLDLKGYPSLPASGVLWYNKLFDSIPIDTTQLLSIDTVYKSRYFYARSIDENSGCIGGLDSVLAIVWPGINAPKVYSDSSCGSNSFTLRADKSEVAHTLLWYDENNNLINIGDSLVTAVLDSTVQFNVVEYNSVTGCQSVPAILRVPIHKTPGIPDLKDTISCGAASLSLVPSPLPHTTTYRWYTDPVTTTILHQGKVFSTPLLSTDTSYWVSGFNEKTGCEGRRKQVKITILPHPGAIDVLGPTLVLKDQSDIVFFTINGQSGSKYNWTIPPGIIIGANMNDFVRLGFPVLGTYTISVRETTRDGCVGEPAYHSIKVIEDSIVINMGGYEKNACSADPYELKPWLFGGTPPYTYSWTGDTAHVSSANTLFTRFNPPGIGQFKLYIEVVDVNLKKAKDSVLITVYESPTTRIANRDSVACVDEDYQLLTISSGTKPFWHQWTGPIHDLSNYLVANPVYAPRKTDTVQFYYLLKDAKGCKAFDSITLVSDKPIADFDILTDPGCSPLPVQFKNTSRRALSYQWSFGDGNTSTQVNPSHTFVNKSPEIKYMEVNLEATSTLGCKDAKKNYAMVWPNPNADITALPQYSCNPAHVMLVSNPGNSTYSWDFGDGTGDTISNRFNVFHTYNNTSLSDKNFKTTVITRSSLNCYDTASINITVYATPVADFVVSPEEAVFPENDFSIDNVTKGDWNFSWDYGDGRTSKKTQPGTIKYDDAGNYTITLRADGPKCADSTRKLVRLKPAPPIANFKGADNGCMPHTVTLVNNSQYADSYLWEFGDGSISTAKDPSYTYYEPGIYKIRLTVSGLGGVSTFSDTTRIYVLPNSFFDIAPRYVYVNDEPVHYFNLSDYGDKYEWDFGDGTGSEELNPKHIYKEAGTYDVTLKVWTSVGCFDLFVMENAVFAEPSGLVEFPNAFRPNSPLEENKTFKPGIIDHVENYHLMIFNRWGELIYESRDQEIGWDGYYEGGIAKQDVYIWKVKGAYSDGKGFVKTGNVTLLY